MITVNPYLKFDGNAADAFNFYRKVFGGNFIDMVKYKDLCDGKTATAGPASEKVMHVALSVGKNSVIMGSDQPENAPPRTKGNVYFVSLNTDSEQEARQFFDALSIGGSIIMPLEKAFWGSIFGMLTDRFGIQWMINYDTQLLKI